MSNEKPVELTATEREADLLLEVGHPSRPDRYQLMHQHIERIKAAARREALLEAAAHFEQYDEVTIGETDIGSNLIPVPPEERLRQLAAAALAEPERDEEGGRDDTPLATPEQIEASRAFLAAQAEWDELRKQVRG